MDKETAFREAHTEYMRTKVYQANKHGGGWIDWCAIGEEAQAPFRNAFESIMASFPAALTEDQRKIICEALRTQAWRLSVAEQELTISECLPDTQKALQARQNDCFKLLQLLEV